MKMRKIFGIISDIDGVLVRGKYPIDKSAAALSYIRQNLDSIFTTKSAMSAGSSACSQFSLSSPFYSTHIPFTCLTNGGGMLEQEKADSINSILHLQRDVQLSEQSMLLNYSPLRPLLSSRKYSDKLVLFAGTGKVAEIAYSCGLTRFLTVDEYASIFPEQFQQFTRVRPPKTATLDTLRNRFGERAFAELMLAQPGTNSLDVDAICIVNDPTNWEDCIQLILAKSFNDQHASRTNEATKRPIEIFTVNNDITYADTFRLNRIAFGPFTACLQRAAHAIYGQNLDIQIYGKPSKLTYDYTKSHLRTLCSDPRDSLGNIYMIGDNPKSDIRGANQNQCVSILVKTGVFHGDNDLEDPAKHVVHDFYEAIKLICSLENVPFTI